MKIYNKMDSYYAIRELGLNYFPEIVLEQNEKEKLDKFLKLYPAEYYALRDKSKAGGKFKLAVKAEDVYAESAGYEKFSINVSSYNYAKNQKLVGEIFISGNEVWCTLSTKPSFSVRDALREPEFNYKTNIFDSEINNIPYFDEVFKYIIKNDLEGAIVEFALFDIAVGVNHEPIVVYELRTHY